jgi:hypothetical protein
MGAAALHQPLLAIYLLDGRADRLGTIDHEQTLNACIDTALEETLQQIFDYASILTGAAYQSQQVLLARIIQPHCSHHMMPGHFDAVDVHAQNIVLMK